MKRGLAFFFLLGSVLLAFSLRSFWLPHSPYPASDFSAAMSAAGHLYDDGKFAEAAQAYEALTVRGAADPALYYNLGNAWFKQGQTGKAVSAYRRAARLAPRDADVQANLALARSRRADKLDEGGEAAALSGVGGMLTLDEWSLLALGAWFTTCLIWVARRLARRGSGLREGLLYALILSALICAGSVFFLGSRLASERTQPGGVILAQEVEVTSAPGGGVVQFTLHSGAEVNVLEQRPGWARLALPGGSLQGWVPESALDCVECVEPYDGYPG